LTLKLFTTGGTIATVQTAGTAGTRAELAGAQLTDLIPHDEDIDVEDLAISPSWALTSADMLRIAMTARDAARSERWSGIVVTHGTSTLEYTAFLGELVNDSEIPIIFTGAMRIATDPNADGPRNLADAIRVAVDPHSHGHRSLVVFAGLVIPARRAWKMKRDEVDAFISVGGRAGWIRDGDIQMPDLPRVSPRFIGSLDDRVAFVKVYPGLAPEVLEAAVPHGWHGLVLEALPGAGGVPPIVHSCLRSIAERVLVVVSSRAPQGRVPSPPSGGTGEPLAGMNLMSAGDLTGEKAWLLLMACLGQSRTPDEARELFRLYASATG
jgi:L-asparaginase